jgi:hypothetical protein
MFYLKLISFPFFFFFFYFFFFFFFFFFLMIPIIERKQRIYEKDEIIKQGLVLCTRTEQWYAKKRTRVKEIKLRKTRLRWRQFQAILRTDRLDLYHSTVNNPNQKLIINLKRE